MFLHRNDPPSTMELIKSKSTQPRFDRRRDTLYIWNIKKISYLKDPPNEESLVGFLNLMSCTVGTEDPKSPLLDILPVLSAEW